MTVDTSLTLSNTKDVYWSVSDLIFGGADFRTYRRTSVQKRSKDSAFCDKGAISGLPPYFFPLSTRLSAGIAPIRDRSSSLACAWRFPSFSRRSPLCGKVERSLSTLFCVAKSRQNFLLKCSIFGNVLDRCEAPSPLCVNNFFFLDGLVCVCGPKQHTGCVARLFPF